MSIHFKDRKGTQSSDKPKSFVVEMIYTIPLKLNTLNKKVKTIKVNENVSTHM
jgi:hypothetical protein